MASDKGKVLSKDLDRRKVMIGAAWSAPVIAVAAATPAHAASPDAVVVTPGTGPEITGWKGDHHYGSDRQSELQRAYDFPINVTDANGNPIVGATVTVVAEGSNRDGDILGVYAYPAPDNSGPESNPHPTATVVTGADGVALFAVSTQNLTSSERPGSATLTVTVTYNGTSTVSVVNVTLTETD